ncbi:hypothetical protein HaLaN_31129 [Haematococcus lacustris]|uniref:Uncharacterized protein n=1 Tax=Haematococcus lacustris TaxID=44745 RepID=A0A6A0AH49_HAELA|nr:hypothetical protein HaLaN_31129 [Haematococcus lacustris]
MRARMGAVTVVLVDKDNNGIVSSCGGGQLSDEVHADMFPAVLRNRRGCRRPIGLAVLDLFRWQCVQVLSLPRWGCHVPHGVGRCAWVPPGCKAGESPVHCVEGGVRRATPVPWQLNALSVWGSDGSLLDGIARPPPRFAS